MVTPSRSYQPGVELKGVRNGGKGGIVSEKYSQDSDEDAILPHSKHASEDMNRPPTSGGNNTANNMHIMRSVTIETSVHNKGEAQPGSGGSQGRGDHYGYPREQGGGRGGYGSYV
jgi:hypothetical protein